MKKKKFRTTLAVALVAAAGLGAYETYQDYKADKESDLVMQNVEALSQADTNSDFVPGLSCEYVTCDDYFRKYETRTIDANEYSEYFHLNSYEDDYQTYAEVVCKAQGHNGILAGSNQTFSRVFIRSERVDCVHKY